VSSIELRLALELAQRPEIRRFTKTLSGLGIAVLALS
jgi:hypothetical protein